MDKQADVFHLSVFHVDQNQTMSSSGKVNRFSGTHEQWHVIHTMQYIHKCNNLFHTINFFLKVSSVLRFSESQMTLLFYYLTCFPMPHIAIYLIIHGWHQR